MVGLSKFFTNFALVAEISTHINERYMDAISNKLTKEALGIYSSRLNASLNSTDNEIILVSHFGNINQPKTNSLLALFEQSILENGIKRKIMKRICSIMIENLQNISIHGATDKKGNQNAMIIMSKLDDQIKIVSGNLIHNEDVGVVDYKLGQINKLSPEEIRRLYIETLCNENFSQKGGAGLGFLTIAKKVIQPIEYRIDSINEELSYLITELNIQLS